MGPWPCLGNKPTSNERTSTRGAWLTRCGEESDTEGLHATVAGGRSPSMPPPARDEDELRRRGGLRRVEAGVRACLRGGWAARVIGTVLIGGGFVG